MKSLKRKHNYFHSRYYAYNKADVKASQDECVMTFNTSYTFGRPALAVARLLTIAIIEYDPIADPAGVFTDPYDITEGNGSFATDLMCNSMTQSLACIHASDQQFTSDELQTALCAVLRFIWQHRKAIESMLPDDKQDLIKTFVERTKDFDAMCDMWCHAVAIGINILDLKTVDEMDKFAEVCKTFTESQ